MAISLEVNCGYARVAIRELASIQRGRNGRQFDRQKTQAEFRELFDLPTFGLPTDYFDTNGHRPSRFDRRCEHQLDIFSKKWKTPTERAEYITTFSTDAWKKLTNEEKAEHSLSNCKACFHHHSEIQATYPSKPIFKPQPTAVTIHSGSEKTNAKHVLKEVNSQWENMYGHTFTDALPKLCPETHLKRKKSKKELKKKSRKQQRKISNHVTQQMCKNATITTLATGESLAQYHRKRMAMSFEYDASEPLPKVPKRHSPSHQKCIPNPDALLHDIENFPPGEYINWSQMARKHNISGSNAGQVVKEFSQAHNIDTSKLEKATKTSRSRPKRCKLPGGEVSSPALPSIGHIQRERDELIKTGKLQLGEPCAPFVLTKYKTCTTGKVEPYQVTIEGCKIPLLSLRNKMLQEHEKYMHLPTDIEYQNMTESEVHAKLRCYNITVPDNITTADLRSMLANYQCTRTLAIWHDHASILGSGYILVTVGVIFDPAVFMSEAEYQAKTGKSLNDIQQIIEEPYIHMIAACSSSAEDQAALISDRLECLSDLSKPLKASNGVQVHDELRFFKGDTPAQQFERGTQKGGHYKCGGCGCKSSLMEDLGHALECKWRSLSNLQSLVLAGHYGNIPGAIKPFESLTTDQLQEELRSRNVFHTSTTKKELKQTLASVLKGAQRVPSLLFLNPSQSLEAINLQHYSVLDCEPMHDLKGHLLNVYAELPHILKGNLRKTCQEIIDTNLSKEKVTCADVRLTAIHLYLQLLESLPRQEPVVQLLQTAVQISEVLYLRSSERSPKRILQLYNCTWLHHTLCSTLFPKTKEVTREVLFGTYIHHLVVHACPQYELVGLRSENAESEERLFGQAKRMATQASNRHPDNVLFNMIIRLQAKQLSDVSRATTEVQKQETRVSKAGRCVPNYPGTQIAKSFIHKHLHSWQSHLKQISAFLIHGKGIWWSSDESSYMFKDGADDQSFRLEGPHLLHHRQTTLAEQATYKEVLWQQIVEKEVHLPTPQIQLYDTSGKPVRRIEFDTTLGEATPEIHTEDVFEQPMENDQFPQTEVLGLPTTPQHQTSLQENSTALPIPSTTPQQPQPQSLTPVNLFQPITENEDEGETHIDPSNLAICDTLQLTSTSVELTTSLARAISKAIGLSNELQQFDRMRSTLKAHKKKGRKLNEQECEVHEELLTQLQAQVLNKKEELKRSVKAYEAQFYDNHKRLPNPAKDENFAKLLKELRYTKCLLAQWHIQL